MFMQNAHAIQGQSYLLPNTKLIIPLIRSLSLLRRQHMRIDVCCNHKVTMPQYLLNQLDIYTHATQQGCSTMAQVMK